MWLRILKQNDLRGVDFDSDLTSNPDWAGSYANHVDLPRIREGRLGGQVSHFLYRFLDGKKTTRSQFSVPGLQKIHRNLKQEKNLILASPFLENPLFVLFPE